MEEGVKKSYSIWSLLVIMTLLAVLNRYQNQRIHVAQ